MLVAGEMGHHSQLNLRIVGGEKELAFFRYEGLAYLLAIVTAHRDILQVRVARRKAPRGGNGLVEGRMDMSGLGVDQLGQRVHIGAEQLLHGAVLEDIVHHGAVLAQGFQHLFAGYILAGLGLLCLVAELQSFKEHLAHLFRR